MLIFHKRGQGLKAGHFLSRSCPDFIVDRSTYALRFFVFVLQSVPAASRRISLKDTWKSIARPFKYSFFTSLLYGFSFLFIFFIFFCLLFDRSYTVSSNLRIVSTFNFTFDWFLFPGNHQRSIFSGGIEVDSFSINIMRNLEMTLFYYFKVRTQCFEKFRKKNFLFLFLLKRSFQEGFSFFEIVIESA